MNYSIFMDFWEDALRSSGFQTYGLFPKETIDVNSSSRSYRVFIPFNLTAQPKFFYVTAEFSWDWDADLSARFATTEDDLLTELFGRENRPQDTQPPLLRVDVNLHATIPQDGFYPAPGNAVWREWTSVVADTVMPFLPTRYENEGKFPAIRSWCGEPEIELSCSSSGQLYLKGVKLAAFQLITLPRNWDDRDRPPEPDPDRQLLEFFQRVRQGLEAWEDALDELAGQ